MNILKLNLSLQEVIEEVELVFAPGDVETTTLEEALEDECVTEEEFRFLKENGAETLIIGETTIFVLQEDGALFTEYCTP